MNESDPIEQKNMVAELEQVSTKMEEKLQLVNEAIGNLNEEIQKYNNVLTNAKAWAERVGDAADDVDTYTLEPVEDIELPELNHAEQIAEVNLEKSE